jgi:amidohydrolase
MNSSTDPLLASLLEQIESELPRAVSLRHRLHAHPELSHAESRTAEAVAAELPGASETVAGTGLLARIGQAGGAPVAVRAELDALRLEEQTGSEFSAHGEAMHACGHDVHMAALVALARACDTLGERIPAALLAVFQPSEEAYPSGAVELARGELAAAKPSAIVAAHLHPEVAWGSVALDPGVVNASCDAVEISVEGRATHGAYPHLGRDPILALAHVVVALNAQAARRVDPLSPAVLTIGMIEGGSADNVIPGEARARGALRAYSPENRRELRELVERVSEGVAAAHGCSARVELVPGEPPLENDAALVAAARELLPGAGLELAAQWRSCGSDDFAFFGELAPIAMGFVGLNGAPGFKPRPLHHPEMLPPDAAVGALARAQAALYLAAARCARH